MQHWQVYIHRGLGAEGTTRKIAIAQCNLLALIFPEGGAEVCSVDNILDFADQPQQFINPGQQVAATLAIYTENTLRAGTVCDLLLGDIYMGFTELRCICS